MRLSVFLFTACISQQLQSQNLVPNGSFEEHYRCPGNFTQSLNDFYVKHWFSASAGTPDHFDACSEGEADVPHNWAGVADAHTGNAYTGLYLWMDNHRNYREYLHVELTQQLIRDTLYEIEFHYKLSSYSKYSIDRIGLHLTDSAVSLKHDKVYCIVPVFSVVKDSALTKETGLWEEAKTYYKAKGGERFLMIGNFDDDVVTRFYKIQFRPAAEPMLANSAYYYIDDVSVAAKFAKDQQAVAQMVPIFDLNQTKENTNYVLKNINFEFNSFRLISSSFAELDRLADFLLMNPGLQIQVFGHTDDQGNDAYNLNLSRARAKNVSEYLSSVGVQKQRIEYFGLGKSKPLRSGSSEEIRAINRRVEIRFIGFNR